MQEAHETSKNRWKKVFNYIYLNEGRCVEHLKRKQFEKKRNTVLKEARTQRRKAFVMAATLSKSIVIPAMPTDYDPSAKVESEKARASVMDNSARLSTKLNQLVQFADKDQSSSCSSSVSSETCKSLASDEKLRLAEEKLHIHHRRRTNHQVHF